MSIKIGINLNVIGGAGQSAPDSKVNMPPSDNLTAVLYGINDLRLVSDLKFVKCGCFCANADFYF